MTSNERSGRPMGRWGRLTRETILVVLVWVVAVLVFRVAPVQQLHDSKYTMLLAENLLRHHDFDLARYDLPSDDYRLSAVGPHRFYFFPVASAVLSAPLVAALHHRGFAAVRPDGSYDERGELAIDARLAAVLMGAFAALVFATAHLVLPAGWSLGVAAVAAFGTQVLSTASRSVWSDTWGILLVGAGVFLLVRAASRRAAMSGALLGTTLALAYVVRPTNAAAIVGAGAYLLVTGQPRAFGRFAAAVTLVVGTFVAHSWSLFRAPLPPYFSGTRLEFRTPWLAVAGNLVSPSRGLLVYVPAVLALGMALVRYRHTLRFRGLLGLAGFVVITHFVVLAAFWDWWGGHSYGARLTTSLVPWFVLLAVLAVDGARRFAASRPGRAAQAVFATVTGIFCIASIAMNAVGAWSFKADRWNVTPDNINGDPARLWTWRRPQFLAPILPVPPPRAAPGKGPVI